MKSGIPCILYLGVYLFLEKKPVGICMAKGLSSRQIPAVFQLLWENTQNFLKMQKSPDVYSSRGTVLF
ncbi:MAG: hypothetical protein H6Q61_1055 [Firmicutes bacterium]|nr:hypothetical protein [Bacillota bacterium]